MHDNVNIQLTCLMSSVNPTFYDGKNNQHKLQF